MSTDYTATDIGSGVAQQTTMNAEWDAIQTALERTFNLYGDSTNGTNALQVNMDFNSKDLLNGGTGYFTDVVIGGTSIADEVAAAAASAAAALASEVAAAASAAAALVSENAAAADAVLTAADVVSTNADVVLTGLDVVSTNADVVLTAADAVATALDAVATAADVILTAADVVLTGLDVASTNADVISTAADAVSTAADVLTTNADVVLTNADVVLTALDVIATAADVVLTGLDVTATNADLVATNQDTIDTAADLVATNQDTIDTAADLVATNQDTIDTAADLVATNQDTIDTAADAVQTALDAIATAADVIAAAASASAASISAAAALASEIAAAASAAAAAGAVTYENMDANGDVGTGAGQLAIGDHVHAASEITTPDIGTPTYNSVQDNLNTFHSAGIIAGAILTDGGSGTVDVAAGSGFIRATDSTVVNLLAFDISAVTALALTDQQINYIYVEYNAGTPQIVATTTKRTDLNTNVSLGNVYRDGTTSHVNTYRAYDVDDHAGKMITRLLAVSPMAYESGAVIAETGTINFSLTAGTFWEGFNSLTTNAFDSSGADTFSYFYKDGVGGWTEVTGQSAINNTQYDDNSGALATLSTPSRYGVHWVYIATDSDVYVIYGQGDYTLPQAQDAQPDGLPPHIPAHATLAGKIIIQKSTTTFYSIASAFDFSFTAAGVTDHLFLSNIGSNTHAQIDTHIADSTLHFTQAAISITESQISDLQSYILAGGVTYEQLDTNGDVGTSAGQLAIGNHTHTGVYEPANANIQTHIALTNEHIDWTADQGATNIHAGNYIDTNTTYVSSDFVHDDLTGFVANEHIDWTADQGATNIHAGNYTDTNTTYVSSDFVHDDLTGFVANEHIDWTADQGATDIHAGNYTNTTYAVGDGGLTEINFTSADNTKLDGIEALADVTDVTNVTAAGALMDSEVDADIKTLVLPASTTISTFGASLIDDVAAINARSTLGLIIGTDVQPFSATNTLDIDVVYALLDTNGDVGTGAGQLAIGNHTHSGVYLADLIDDTTPTLGGDLDGNGKLITGLGTVNASISTGYGLYNESSSSTNPTLVPRRNDASTGVGGASSEVSLIAVGVEMVTCSTTKTAIKGIEAPLDYNAQTGTTYTGVLTDAEKIISMNNAAANTFTIPANASVAYPVGTKLNFLQLGAGATTIAITTDTLNVDATYTKVLDGQYSIATALKVTSTTWVIFGNLVAA